MATFIVTWNPDRWWWDPRERAADIKRTASGRVAKGGWTTGSRKGGITPGDRVFLLRQGPEPRGIVASGTFTSAVFTVDHWDETPGKDANATDISWDVVLGDSDLLPLALLESQIIAMNWEPRAGGVRVSQPSDAALERLWASHTGRQPEGEGPVKSDAKFQGWQADPLKRRLAEDHTQDLLEKHYRQMRWKVADTRRGNPFDAIATKGKQTRYLEAKGTETDGASVLVTPGEVKFARSHPGECVIGIVSGIKFLAGGALDSRSGKLATHDWDPDSGGLVPTAYTWAPPARKARTHRTAKP